MPGQDARFGRDAAQANGQLAPAKVGGGNAGFDFTALDATGAVTTTLGSHACVKDNITQLIWSTETISNKPWAVAGSWGPTYTRCGYTTGWRLPTRRELLSIVDYSRRLPAIDANFFRYTQISFHWTSDVFAPDRLYAWLVSFSEGSTVISYKTEAHLVRLVRSGP